MDNLRSVDCITKSADGVNSVEDRNRKFLRNTRRKMLKTILMTCLSFFLASSQLMAQAEMASQMRSDGKIYVVIVVLATIFAGIFAYLVYMDRKIARIEKDRN